MQNDKGDNVDLYIPRKCSWTNRVLHAKDRASVQIAIGRVDPETGLFTGEKDIIALSGYIRQKGEADRAVNELTKNL